MMRHAMTALMAMALCSRSAVRNGRNSVFQPDLKVPKEVLDTPSLEVVADDLGRGSGVVDVDGGEQEPLHRLLLCGRVGLQDVHCGHRHRFAGRAGCRQFDLAEAQRAMGVPLAARRARLLPARFRALAQALDLDLDAASHGLGEHRRRQLAPTASRLWADERIHSIPEARSVSPLHCNASSGCCRVARWLPMSHIDGRGPINRASGVPEWRAPA